SKKQVPVQISLSDEGEDNFPHNGVVDFTDNKLDINTGTLRYRAKLDNKDRFITPGMYVRVRLPIGSPHSAGMISDQALVTDQGEKGGYMVGDHEERALPKSVDGGSQEQSLRKETEPAAQRAYWSKVTLARPAQKGMVEISSGVRAGDWVVVSGTQKL